MLNVSLPEQTVPFSIKDAVNNIFTFPKVACNTYCCVNNVLTYQLSLSPTSMVATNSIEFSAITDNGREMQFTVNTDNPLTREIYVYVQSTKQIGGTATGFSPKQTISVTCSLTTQPFITDPDTTYQIKQYAPAGLGSESSYSCSYFTVGNPTCQIASIKVIEEGDLTQTHSPLFKVPVAAPGVSPCRIQPIDVTIERVYRFKIQMIDKGGVKSALSTTKILVIGCPESEIQYEPTNIPTVVYVNATHDKIPNAFIFPEPKSVIPHCYFVKTELLDVTSNGIPSNTSIELNPTCITGAACNRIDVLDSKKLYVITFKMKFTLNGRPDLLYMTNTLAINIMCGINFKYLPSFKQTSFRFFLNDPTTLVLEELGCSIEHCCDDTVYSIKTSKNQTDLDKTIGPVIWDKTNKTIKMKVNTTELGTWIFSLVATQSVKQFVTQEFNVTVDFPCEREVFTLNPVIMEDEDIAVVQDYRFLPRIVYNASTSNTYTPWTYNISSRFSKVSPPGYCPVTFYKIDKVMSDQSLVEESVQNLLFSVTKDGLFTIKKMDVPLVLYKVYISPCNRLTCGKLGNDVNNFTAIVSINAIPNPPTVMPEFSTPLVSPVIQFEPGQVGKFTYKLPEIKDAKDTDIKVVSSLEPFITYQSDTRTFTFDKALIKQPIKVTIEMELTDVLTQNKQKFSIGVNVQRKINLFQRAIITEQEQAQESKGITRKPKVDLKSSNLIASISGVSVYGEVTISFNYPVKVLDLGELGKKMQLYVSVSKQRRDTNGFKLEQIDFVWFPVKMTETGIDLKVNFTFPLELSPLVEQDVLVVKFKQPDKIFSPEINASLHANYHELYASIKKQIPETEFNKNVDSTADNTHVFMTVILVLAAVLNIFTTGRAMIAMLMMIRAMQLLFHLPLLRVIFPGNVMMIYNTVRPLVAFEVLDLFFNFDALSQYSSLADSEKEVFPQLIDLGFSTPNIFLNMKSLAIVIVIYLMQVVIWIIIRLYLLILPSNFIVARIKNSLSDSLFFNDFNSIQVEAYIDLVVVIIVALQYSNRENAFDNVSYLISLVMMGTTHVLLPLNLIWIATKKQVVLESESFKERWGVLYEGVSVKTRTKTLFYFFFVLRRLLFVYLGFLVEIPIAQILGVQFINQAFIIYQGNVKPLQYKLENVVELINEWLITIQTLHILLFTDFIPEQEMQFLCGWSSLLFLALMIIVNLSLVIYFSFISLRLIFRKYYIRRQHNQRKQAIVRLMAEIRNLKKNLPKNQRILIERELRKIQRPGIDIDKSKRIFFTRLERMTNPVRKEIQNQLEPVQGDKTTMVSIKPKRKTSVKAAQKKIKAGILTREMTIQNLTQNAQTLNAIEPPVDSKVDVKPKKKKNKSVSKLKKKKSVPKKKKSRRGSKKKSKSSTALHVIAEEVTLNDIE